MGMGVGWVGYRGTTVEGPPLTKAGVHRPCLLRYEQASVESYIHHTQDSVEIYMSGY